MPRGVIERQERLLCAAVDQVFVTSPQLRRQLTPVSRRLRFDPNVVDQEHFATAMAFDKKDLPSDLAAIPEPGSVLSVQSVPTSLMLLWWLP